MGNIQTRCQDNRRPQKLTLQQLLEKAPNINDHYDAKDANACGPRVPGEGEGSLKLAVLQQGFGWPDNGEFAWGGYGSSCNYCIGQAGCVCNGGAVGVTPVVKRVAYKGDPTNCCRSQSKLDGGTTCDPKWKGLENGNCDDPMRAFCAVDDRIITDQGCITWRDKRNDDVPGVREMVEAACRRGSNMRDNNECQNFFHKSDNRVIGDAIYRDYCSAHMDDVEWCACQNWKQLFTSQKLKDYMDSVSALPECYVSACAGNTKAYKTLDMKTEDKCPNTVLNICDTSITVYDNAQVKENKITCNPGAKDSTIVTGTYVDETNNTWMIYLVITLVILMIFGLAGYMARDTKFMKDLIKEVKDMF